MNVRNSGAAAPEAIYNIHPNIAIIDIGLPKLNGWEVAARIRARLGKQMPVLIALTGYGQEEDYRKSMEAGFAYHLVKLVAPVDLLNLIQDLTRPQRTPTSAPPAALNN